MTSDERIKIVARAIAEEFRGDCMPDSDDALRMAKAAIAALDSTQPTAWEERERELRDLAAALEGDIIRANTYANDLTTANRQRTLTCLRGSMRLATRLREKLSTTQPRGDL